MEERFMPASPGEAQPPSVEADAPDGPAAAGPLADSRALQILTTEHWSLLSARSLVYNEAFARSGMFLAFLSATLLVLGLISTATGFSDAFLVIAAIVLALDLFVGLATLGRISGASEEDIRYLQGMNRIRHAYMEMVPGLERYFITTGYDDLESVVAFYGPPVARGSVSAIVHGLTTTPGMLAAIIAAVSGGLAGILTILATRDPVAAGIVALTVLLFTFGVIAVWGFRAVAAFDASLGARFPRPPGAGPPER